MERYWMLKHVHYYPIAMLPSVSGSQCSGRAGSWDAVSKSGVLANHGSSHNVLEQEQHIRNSRALVSKTGSGSEGMRTGMLVRWLGLGLLGYVII